MKNLVSELKPARRIPLTLGVGFRKNYGRNEIDAKLLNISVSGAFLKVNDANLEPSEKINLRFQVGSRERNLVATVVWRNQYGAGIKFSHSNNRDIQIVDDLMYFVEESRQDRKSVLRDIFDQVA